MKKSQHIHYTWETWNCNGQINKRTHVSFHSLFPWSWTHQFEQIDSAAGIEWKNDKQDFSACLLFFAVLHYVWFSQFWSHFHGTMHCLPQRLKSTFLKFFKWSGSEGASGVRKNSKTVDFSLWGNRAITQSTFFDIFKETKIMKITYST